MTISIEELDIKPLGRLAKRVVHKFRMSLDEKTKAISNCWITKYCKLIISCCLTFYFFLTHFPKIHRSVLCKKTMDLFYFWDFYNVNLWEKNFSRSKAYSCRKMSLYNFIVLRKNIRHSWRLSKWSKTF